ncbi:MAG: PEP-CTERM sorting domain-containing protein [Planctomycetota bacterium]|nr:PEP-CTERM sorting domain-containing protein [Planctomycetota bacterium]
MNCQRIKCVVFCVSISTMLVVCSQAVGFNPQPEPPGIPQPDNWYVEGFVDMCAQAVDPTSAAMPFGIDPHIVGDAVVDFSAGVIARFDAPSTAYGKPVDGLYDADFQYFLLRMGDTIWNETMLGTIQFRVSDGMVDGCSGVITYTIPSHPDLSFALPASPGTWVALDERDEVNLGTVTGTYTLRDGIVPEPATLSLLAFGMPAMLKRRRK